MSRNFSRSGKKKKKDTKELILTYHVVSMVGVILVRAVRLGKRLHPALVLKLRRLVAVRVRDVVVLVAVEGRGLLEALALGVEVCSRGREARRSVSHIGGMSVVLRGVVSHLWEGGNYYVGLLTLRELLALSRPRAVI